MPETTIRFVINRDEIKKTMSWDDLETIELAQEGDVKSYRMKRLAARFMVDENKKPIPYKQALAILGRLPLDEVGDVLSQFTAAFQDGAVPPTNGNPLSSPSEAAQLSGFPPGSEQ